MPNNRVFAFLVLAGLLATTIMAPGLTASAQGTPIVYVVIAVDTESDNHHLMDTYPPVLGIENYLESGRISQVMAQTLRQTSVDSYGQPYKMTWFAEMDNYVNQAQLPGGTPADYLTFRDLLVDKWGTDLERWGDEIAFHHHFMRWNGSHWLWYDMNLANYSHHNAALASMAFNGDFCPSAFRSGWLWSTNQSQAWIDNRFPMDYSNNPGTEFWNRSSSWFPYHPSTDNYLEPGTMQHWIAQCHGSASQEGVNAAFDEANRSRGPVIYCWYMHQDDYMDASITNARNYLLQAATAKGIPFAWVTASEAMRGIIGSTDTTPPTLMIGGASGVYTITSNEDLWADDPFVAGKYVAGDREVYTYPTVTQTAARTWQVSLPNTWAKPPEAYTLARATAQSEAEGHPAGHAIDGDLSTFWDSASLPAWIQVDLGQAEPVGKMEIHFDEEGGFEYNYYAEASTDGSQWTQIVPPSVGQGEVAHQFNPATTMRYARITITQKSGGDGAQIVEIALYDPLTTYELRGVAAASSDTSANCAVALLPIPPTAATIVSFVAQPEADRIALTWETSTETNNMGFNLYRSDGTANGPYSRLNDALISSQAPGSPLGAVYTWLDPDVLPGHRYYYKLEDLDLSGQSTMHGPVWAAIGTSGRYAIYLPMVIK